MRKVVVSEFLTVDGVMQGPGGPDEDREGGFQEGGWQLPYFDEAGGAAVAKGLAETAACCSVGRRTRSSPLTGRTKLPVIRSPTS